jgi:hypothetical protein
MASWFACLTSIARLLIAERNASKECQEDSEIVQRDEMRLSAALCEETSSADSEKSVTIAKGR